MQKRITLRWKSAAGTLLIGILGVAAAGCAPRLGPEPKLSLASDYAADRVLAAPKADWPSDAWWKIYQDPQLDQLIDESLAGAPDLRIAEARLRVARGQAMQAGSALYPSLSVDGSVEKFRQSVNQGYPTQFKEFIPKGWRDRGTLNATLDYEIDFFGKNRAALAAAASQAEAAAADLAAARLAISTAVATAYADLARLYADRQAAEDVVRVRNNSAGLVDERRQNGLENQGALSQARALEFSAKADLDALDGEIARTRNQIAALLGKGPDRGLEIQPPHAPSLRPLGLPEHLSLDLVGRRPDIVAARMRAEAARQRVKVARANFYPNVNIAALVGYQSIGLSLLTQNDSLYGHYGPAVHLPIFEGGRLRGAYTSSRGDYDEAVATYDKTLTAALRDVADAVANYRSVSTQLTNSRAALAAGEDAYSIARQRYQGGLSSYIDVLTAENALVVQRRQVADLEAQALSLDIALVRALGGGYVAA